MSSKDLENMSVDDVAKMIREAGFGDNAQFFKDAEISGPALFLLTEDHLKEMGIKAIGPRLLILRHIKKITGRLNPQPRPAAIVDAPASRLPAPQPVQFQSPHQERSTQKASNPMARSMPAKQKSSEASRPQTANPPGEKPKFVRDHEKMVESIRAARRYMKYQKDLEEGKAVGPPPELPPIEEPPDLVQCPTCGRKMGEEAARHHFPVCARMNQGRMNTSKYSRK